MGNKGCVRTIGKDHKDKQIAISPAVSHPSPKNIQLFGHHRNR